MFAPYIDKLSHDFIKNGNQMNLVNWKKISWPNAQGGLGIHMAREANTSLLGKLVWDIQETETNFGLRS